MHVCQRAEVPCALNQLLYAPTPSPGGSVLQKGAGSGPKEQTRSLALQLIDGVVTQRRQAVWGVACVRGDRSIEAKQGVLKACGPF